MNAANSDNLFVLSKAMTKAAAALGLSMNEVKVITGIHFPIKNQDKIPENGSLNHALQLLQCYQYIFELTGGNKEDIKHWMHTQNRHTGGVPVKQIPTVNGFNEIKAYLENLCHKP